MARWASRDRPTTRRSLRRRPKVRPRSAARRASGAPIRTANGPGGAIVNGPGPTGPGRRATRGAGGRGGGGAPPRLDAKTHRRLLPDSSCQRTEQLAEATGLLGNGQHERRYHEVGHWVGYLVAEGP